MRGISYKIVNDALALLTRSIVIKIIGIPIFFITANVLGPQGLALLKLIEIVPSLAKFGIIHYPAVVARESADLPRNVDGNLIPGPATNTAYTATVLTCALLAIGVAAVAPLLTDETARWALPVAALNLAVGGVLLVLRNNCKVNKAFKLLALGESLGEFVRLVVIAGLVWVIGLYANVLAGLVSALVMVWVFSRRIGMGFRLQLDAGELKRQTRLALPLTAGTIGFGLWSLGQRWVVGIALDLEGLGLFMMAVALIEYLTMLINVMLQATGIHIYEHYHGASAESASLAAIVSVPTQIVAYALPLGMALLTLFGDEVLRVFAPSYLEVAGFMHLLALDAWLVALPSFYAVTMTSRSLNMQWYVVAVRIASIGLFAMGAGVVQLASHAQAGDVGAWLSSAMPELITPSTETMVRWRLIADALLLALIATLTRRRMFGSLGAWIREWAAYILPLGWFGVVCLAAEAYPPTGSPQRGALIFVGALVAYLPLLYLLDRRIGLSAYLTRALRKRA